MIINKLKKRSLFIYSVNSFYITFYTFNIRKLKDLSNIKGIDGLLVV